MASLSRQGVLFAEQVRREVGIPTAAVGLIAEPQQANDIIQKSTLRFGVGEHGLRAKFLAALQAHT